MLQVVNFLLPSNWK